MKYLFQILFFSITTTAIAQTNFNSESFAVSKSDLETNRFEKDSTANAIVIYESGNSFVRDSGSSYELNTEIKRKIKILNKEAFDEANITIYLYENDRVKEKVKKIKATTYNLIDGKVIKTELNKSNIYEEAYNDNHTLIKFALPNIKEGSVITYSYTTESPFFFKFKGWKFQDYIPVIYSTYKTSIPANWEYNIKLVGALKLFEHKSKLKKKCLSSYSGAYADCSESLYTMKDIPAFIEEDYMTAEKNFLSRIEYELKTFKSFDGRVKHYTKDWKSADKDFNKNPNFGFGHELKKSNLIKGIFLSKIEAEAEPLNKAKVIYKSIQEFYTWNKEYHLFKDVSVKNLIKNKSGSVAEINMLLYNMLNHHGIKVNPVLLSTRNNGVATKLYPIISEFNYIIVEANINGKLYLLDATDDYLSFGELPFRCLNGYGRQLDFKNGSQWINIKPEKSSAVQHYVNLNFNEKNEIIGDVKSRYTGYKGLHRKKEYFPNPEEYINDFASKQTNFEVTNHIIKSEDKTEAQFQESYDITMNHDSFVADKIYFNPFITKFIKSNPFKLQQRTYPIDFGYKSKYFYSFSFEISKMYTIEEIPKDVHYKLPNNTADVTLATKVTDNKITLSVRVNINKTVYSPEYYEYFKDLFGKIIDIQNKSLIVLKKK